jgi:hypothetical protein
MISEKAIVATTIVGAFMGIASVVAVPWMLVRMPADYFKHPRPHLVTRLKTASTKKKFILVGKNLLGVMLAVAGVAMLVLPGQGILTIIVALILTDLPNKHAFERRLVMRPKVRQAIDWLRARQGRPPLDL